MVIDVIEFYLNCYLEEFADIPKWRCMWKGERDGNWQYKSAVSTANSLLTYTSFFHLFERLFFIFLLLHPTQPAFWQVYLSDN